MDLNALEKHELIQYCKELKKENEALQTINKNSKTWVSLLTHDIKGLLSSFAWLNNLYQGGSITLDAMEKLMPDLKANAEKSLRAMNDTLLSTRFQYEKIFAREDEIHVGELLSGIVLDMEKEISDKGLKIKFIGDMDARIHSNKLMLKSILIKLLHNAMKYSFENQEIHVGYSRLSDSRSQFSIQDFGEGIHEYNRDKLFTWESTPIVGTAGEKGSGLGLILVKEALLLINGEVEITSNDGNGTLVVFSL